MCEEKPVFVEALVLEQQEDQEYPTALCKMDGDA